MHTPLISDERAERERLCPQEAARYSRHVILKEFSLQSQLRLKAARALIVGAGGLGSPASMYLAAAGVGTIGLVEHDTVDLSNLQRQLLYETADVGRAKLSAAAESLRGLNPHVTVIPHETHLNGANAMEVVAGYDLIIDGTDNFPTRYLVNDVCVLLGKPNAYGSVFQFEGQASVFFAPHGPCYRCLFPEPPMPGTVPTCAEGGVLGVLPGVIGLIQATEAVKLITGLGEPLIGRLALFDALGMRFREMKLRRDPHCPVCGDTPSITTPIDYEEFCGIGQGLDRCPTVMDETIEEIGPVELRARLDRGDQLVLLDVRNETELELSRLPDNIIHIPLLELAQRTAELNPGLEIVSICRTGSRSKTAVELLRSAGFKRVINLRGGMNAYAELVDPTIITY